MSPSMPLPPPPPLPRLMFRRANSKEKRLRHNMLTFQLHVYLAWVLCSLTVTNSNIFSCLPSSRSSKKIPPIPRASPEIYINLIINEPCCVKICFWGISGQPDLTGYQQCIERLRFFHGDTVSGYPLIKSILHDILPFSCWTQHALS